MEYQYYVDQIQNQTTGATNPPETGSTEAAIPSLVTPEVNAESPATAIVAPTVAEVGSDRLATEEGEAPTSLNASKERGADSEYKNGSSLIANPPWSDSGTAEQALPLADAFTRRQHYVESLLTCCAASRQWAVQSDPLDYLRLRAKNESIMCELTNARARFTGRTGRLSMPLSHKIDLRMYHVVVLFILYIVAGFLLFGLFDFFAHFSVTLK
jgi:hypothetical protein